MQEPMTFYWASTLPLSRCTPIVLESTMKTITLLDYLSHCHVITKNMLHCQETNLTDIRVKEDDRHLSTWRKENLKRIQRIYGMKRDLDGWGITASTQPSPHSRGISMLPLLILPPHRFYCHFRIDSRRQPIISVSQPTQTTLLFTHFSSILQPSLAPAGSGAFSSLFSLLLLLTAPFRLSSDRHCTIIAENTLWKATSLICVNTSDSTLWLLAMNSRWLKVPTKFSEGRT